MEVDPKRFPSSIRALSTALGYPVKYGSLEAKTYRRLLKGEVDIGTVGLNPRALAVICIWRTLCQPRGLTLIATGTSEFGESMVQFMEAMIGKVPYLRNKVWICKGDIGICTAHSQSPQCIHGRPAEILDRNKLDALRTSFIDDVLVVIPSIDQFDGKHLKRASILAADYGFSMLVNVIPK